LMDAELLLLDTLSSEYRSIPLRTLPSLTKPFAYTCGYTISGDPHVGHARLAVTVDVLVRTIKLFCPTFEHIRNITDINYFIVEKYSEKDVWEKDMLEGIEQYQEFESQLGVLPPDGEPRSSDQIPTLLEMFERLAPRNKLICWDGGLLAIISPEWALSEGNIFPSTKEWLIQRPGFNALPVWQSKTGTQLSWVEKWGDGWPHWHVQCVANSFIREGEFLFHAGGSDLATGGGSGGWVAHHGCELLLAEAFETRNSPLSWFHVGLVLNESNEKMSNSTTYIDVNRAVGRYSALGLRCALLSFERRSNVTWGEICEAIEAFTPITQGIEARIPNMNLRSGIESNGGLVLEQYQLAHNKNNLLYKLWSALLLDIDTPKILGLLIENTNEFFTLLDSLIGEESSDSRFLFALLQILFGDLL
jgi:cysteinyl-tRNA synthetase